MDVRDLTTFEDGTFDVAIDKGKGAFGWAWAVVSGLGLMICAERYDGRDDDCQGRRVGELALPCAYRRKIRHDSVLIHRLHRRILHNK